jgi:hypothetical protein
VPQRLGKMRRQRQHRLNRPPHHAARRPGMMRQPHRLLPPHAFPPPIPGTMAARQWAPPP